MQGVDKERKFETAAVGAGVELQEPSSLIDDGIANIYFCKHKLGRIDTRKDSIIKV